MKKFLSVKLSGIILISFLTAMVAFHLLVLLGVVSSDIVWGGQIENQNSLTILELFSIFLTLIFIFIVAIKAGFIKNPSLKNVGKYGIWIIMVYFVLNTFGNLMAASFIEKLIFTPLTILSALIAYRLTKEKAAAS